MVTAEESKPKLTLWYIFFLETLFERVKYFIFISSLISFQSLVSRKKNFFPTVLEARYRKYSS